MIYVSVQAHGRVCRAPSEAKFGRDGHKQVTVGLTVNVSGEFLEVNGVGYGDIADELLCLRVGDAVELSGPIQLRTLIAKDGDATATFDVKVRRIAKAHVNGSGS